MQTQSETDDKKAKQRIRQSMDMDSAPILHKAVIEGDAKKEELKASSSQNRLDALLDSLSPEVILKELLGDLFIHPDSLEEEELLGEGAYATVHRSSLSPSNGGVCYEVAVKKLKPEVLSEMHDLKDFLKEANLMRKLKSPNIVQIVGIGASNLYSLESVRGSVYLVMEAMNGGNLKELVLRQMLSGGKPVYELSDALGWCIDIANAMSYLHQVCKPMIIHRDLKLENALVGGGASGFSRAKLADFGLHKRAKVNAQGALAAEASLDNMHKPGVGSKSSSPNLHESASMKKVSSFNDMSFYGGDVYYQQGVMASKSIHCQSIHTPLPSVPEVPLPVPSTFEVRPSPSLQEQLAAADKRSHALSKLNSGLKPVSQPEIHGSEHGGTSALEALKAAGYDMGVDKADASPLAATQTISQRVLLPPIPGSCSTGQDMSVHQGSVHDATSNQSSGSKKYLSSEQMAAQAFMNPLPPGMIEVPGESLHRKMIALMALDRAAAIAAVAVGPYCPRPPSVGTSGPMTSARDPPFPSAAVSGGGQILSSESTVARMGGESTSQSNIQVDVMNSAKIRDAYVSQGKLEDNARTTRNPDGSRKGWKFADATQAVGSLMYMAPELFTSHSYNEKVDVFSFAIMSYELFTGRLLALRSDFMVGGQSAVEEYVDRRAKQGERERMPSRWPEPLKDLIASMWDQNPEKRPSFSEVLVALKSIRDSRILDSVSATATSGGAGCGCVIS